MNYKLQKYYYYTYLIDLYLEQYFIFEVHCNHIWVQLRTYNNISILFCEFLEKQWYFEISEKRSEKILIILYSSSVIGTYKSQIAEGDFCWLCRLCSFSCINCAGACSVWSMRSVRSPWPCIRRWSCCTVRSALSIAHCVAASTLWSSKCRPFTCHPKWYVKMYKCVLKWSWRFSNWYIGTASKVMW